MTQSARAVVGIDAGTSTFEVSCISRTGLARPIDFPDGGDTLRSVAFFEDAETPLIGAEAENMGLNRPERMVRHWKRAMGGDEALYTSPAGVAWTAEDLLVRFLELCKNAAEADAGLIHDHAVITVPANYADAAKASTRNAGQRVGFDRVELIHEPTAAAFARLANGEKPSVADGIRLVCDKGGGTFDATVLEKAGNDFHVRATGGVPHLGGMDHTQTLVDLCIDRFVAKTGATLSAAEHPEAWADLWFRCEAAKPRLNHAGKATIHIVCDTLREQITLTDAEVREATRPLITQMIACIEQTLRDAGVALDEVIELLPVGGGSQFFVVREALQEFFGRPLSDAGDPIHCVAHGAALRGWEAAGEVQVDSATRLPAPGRSVRDVTAHPLGVLALTEAGERAFTPILAKGAPMPSRHRKTFRLSEDGATEVDIRILQGLGSLAPDDCAELGQIAVSGLQPVWDRPHNVDIELSIDADGLLTATATDPLDGATADMTCTYTR